jgi:hypothetical protein
MFQFSQFHWDFKQTRQCVTFYFFVLAFCDLVQERDAMVKNIRKSVAEAVKMGMKSQEPLVNVPTKDWQFAFKIRVCSTFRPACITNYLSTPATSHSHGE